MGRRLRLGQAKQPRSPRDSQLGGCGGTCSSSSTSVRANDKTVGETTATTPSSKCGGTCSSSSTSVRANQRSVVEATTSSKSTKPASLLYMFEESEFQLPDQKPRWTCFLPFKRCCFSRRHEEKCSVAEISSVISGLATWGALPTDLLLVALVYMDRLLDTSVHPSGATADGRLTATTWRPILAVCMLLASKVWEDWCMFGFEVAEYMKYSPEGVLRLELLAMDTFRWNVNISAEVFAPYFWAVTAFLKDGEEPE